jgi:hypothetical protein
MVTTSTNALIAHPLLVHLTGMNRWQCVAYVPDAEQYVLAPRPNSDLGPNITSVEWELMETGGYQAVKEVLARQRLTILSPYCAIMDTREKRLYHVDLVAEQDGRACLILLTHTRSRMSKRARSNMVSHLEEMASVCREHYTVAATVMAINVQYGPTGVVETKLFKGGTGLVRGASRPGALAQIG